MGENKAIMQATHDLDFKVRQVKQAQPPLLDMDHSSIRVVITLAVSFRGGRITMVAYVLKFK